MYSDKLQQAQLRSKQGQPSMNCQWNISYKGPQCIFSPIQASDDELAVDIVYCNDFQLVESGPGIRPFSAAIFATTAHRLVHFRRLRHLWIVKTCINDKMSIELVVNVSMTRYPRKSSRFFKFLKFQKIKNVTVECDYCNYAGFGNDYRYIGTVDDLFEHF